MITVVVHIQEQEKGIRFTAGSVLDHPTDKEDLVFKSFNDTLTVFAKFGMEVINERPILSA